MTSSTSSTSNASTSLAHANKGFRTSCLNCRRRKIRCDSQRPACTACLSSIVYGDCEYAAEGGTLTQTQCLEEQIALLESRIQRLEDPTNPEGAVFLTDPYAPHIASGPSQLRPDKLSAPARDNLIQIALQHRTEIGFFLDPKRFLGTLTTSDTNGRPLKALMSAVLLWGSHLSEINDSKRYEVKYRARAVRDTAQGLASGHPQAVMHSIQAEILLAHYFYRQSRFVEGKYHASVTVSLALSAKLHKIRSIDGPSDVPNATSLPPPPDAVEEGERINGFWTVFMLNKSWAAADDSPSPFQCTFSPEARIDVPWPLEIENFQIPSIQNDVHRPQVLGAST
ncbi:hypothetical protein CPB85DRAFT_775849 [Mucidula mucida]|nr:hypothetical protein CPB85DRAFT_775849 [Mucidula mucida]